MVDERRRYFRIQDTIELGYRLLTAEELEEPEALLGRGELLDGVEKEIATLLLQFQSRHPDMVRILELLNRKVDLVHHMIEQEKRLDMTHEYEIRQVDISGCGAAFPVEDAYRAGDLLLVQIILPAPFRPVRVIASIVSCKPLQKPLERMRHMARVEFTHMLEKDQELLIQYLMKRQVTELKARREARDKWAF